MVGWGITDSTGYESVQTWGDSEDKEAGVQQSTGPQE